MTIEKSCPLCGGRLVAVDDYLICAEPGTCTWTRELTDDELDMFYYPNGLGASLPTAHTLKETEMAQMVSVKMAYSNTFYMSLLDAQNLIELVAGKRIEYVSTGNYKRVDDDITIETKPIRIRTVEDTPDEG